MLGIERTDRIFEAALELQQGRSSAGERKKIGDLIRSRRVKRLSADEAYSKYLEAREAGTAVNEHGDILSFFEFLVQNWDSIWSMIQKIITLFDK